MQQQWQSVMFHPTGLKSNQSYLRILIGHMINSYRILQTNHSTSAMNHTNVHCLAWLRIKIELEGYSVKWTPLPTISGAIC